MSFTPPSPSPTPGISGKGPNNKDALDGCGPFLPSSTIATDQLRSLIGVQQSSEATVRAAKITIGAGRTSFALRSLTLVNDLPRSAGNHWPASLRIGPPVSGGEDCHPDTNPANQAHHGAGIRVRPPS